MSSVVDIAMLNHWTKQSTSVSTSLKNLSRDDTSKFLTPENIAALEEAAGVFENIINEASDRHLGSEHVDRFVSYNMDKKMAHAQMFFLMKRLPAMMQAMLSEYIDALRLYCTYEGTRYQVTGASRFGDVYLHPNLVDKVSNYEHRVSMKSCTNWSANP